MSNFWGQCSSANALLSVPPLTQVSPTRFVCVCAKCVCLTLSLSLSGCVWLCVCVCLPYRRCCHFAAAKQTHSTSCWLNIKKSTLDAARVIQRAFCYATICATVTPPCHPLHPLLLPCHPSGCLSNNFLKYFAFASLLLLPRIFQRRSYNINIKLLYKYEVGSRVGCGNSGRSGWLESGRVMLY